MMASMMKRPMLAVCVVACAVCAWGDTVVVNLGPYRTAEQAGRAEADVNWLDADPSDDTICTEAFAALELVRWAAAEQGTDRRVIVDDDREPDGDVILIGGPASNALSRSLAPRLGLDAAKIAALGPQGYVLRSRVLDGRRVTVVAGGSRLGTLYGVYDLLHRLGARWFSPADHDSIPATRAIPDLDVTETPDFLTRGFHAWEDRGDEAFLLWMARNRLNYWCVQQSNHPLLRKLGIQMSCGGHTAQALFLHPDHAYPYNHARFEGDETRPDDPYPVSDQFRGDADKNGTLSYFEAHPDWYALVGGKRVPGFKGEFGTNYCSSNADATTEFMKNYVQCLVDGEYRDATVVRFWTLDGGKWCQCEACKALGIPTDRNLLLVHRLAQEIKNARAEGRIHRRIIIRFLAYHDVLKPPTRPLPRDFDYGMCSATFFPIVRCYVHRFDDPACGRNRHYRTQLDGWAVDPKRHYQGQLCIGEYYNVSGYKCLPIVFMHTMATDIPTYHRLGARHFHYMHVVTRNWGNKALTNWQMARQLWDVKTDCPKLWEDYFAGRYGPAAGTMRAFYESLEKMLCNVSELKYGLARRLNAGSKDLFPTSHLRGDESDKRDSDGPTLAEIAQHARHCRALISEVLGAAPAGAVRARIEEDERLFTYGERTVLYYHACAEAFRLARLRDKDARKHFTEARRLAKLLRQDTTSTKSSSAHANESNAFAASRATGALAHLARLLGPAEPAAVKTFDPAKQPLVLTGRDFAGGGALKYGHGLHVFPGRKKVSDDGNNVYAKPTGAFSTMNAWFRLDAVPEKGLAVTLVGLSRPVTDEDKIPMEMLVNGKSVFRGDAPFSLQGLSRHVVPVPAAALVKGRNRITLRNLVPEGPVGNRPWFGIDRAELRAE